MGENESEKETRARKRGQDDRTKRQRRVARKCPGRCRNRHRKEHSQDRRSAHSRPPDGWRRASHLPQARESPRIRNVAAVPTQLCSRHLAQTRKGRSMKLARAAHLISVRALVIVIAAVAGIAGLLITAGPGASAQTGSAHARSAPGSAALTAQRACP